MTPRGWRHRNSKSHYAARQSVAEGSKDSGHIAEEYRDHLRFLEERDGSWKSGGGIHASLTQEKRIGIDPGSHPSRGDQLSITLYSQDRYLEEVNQHLQDSAALSAILNHVHGVCFSAMYWIGLLGPLPILVSRFVDQVKERSNDDVDFDEDNWPATLYEESDGLVVPVPSGSASLYYGLGSGAFVDPLLQWWRTLCNKPWSELDQPDQEGITNGENTLPLVLLERSLKSDPVRRIARLEGLLPLPPAIIINIPFAGRWQKLIALMSLGHMRAVPRTYPNHAIAVKAMQGPNEPSPLSPIRLTAISAASRLGRDLSLIDLNRSRLMMITSVLPALALEDWGMLSRNTQKLRPNIAFVSGGDPLRAHGEAQSCEAAKMVVCTQHGGWYFESIPSHNEIWERVVSDRYLTWGFSESSREVAVASFRLSSLRRHRLLRSAVRRNPLKGKVEIRYFVSSQPGPDFRGERELFRTHQSNLVRTLAGMADDCSAELRVRIDHRTPRFQAGVLHEALEALDDNEAEAPEEVPLRVAYWRSDLVVVDMVGTTTFLQCIAGDVPCLIVLPQEAVTIRYSALGEFDDLLEAGVAVTIESLAAALESMGGNPRSWWREPQRRRATSRYRDRFAKSSSFPIIGWAKQLARLRRELQ